MIGDILTVEQIAAVSAYAKTLPVFMDDNKMPGAKNYRGPAHDRRRHWRGFDWAFNSNLNLWSRCSPDYPEILTELANPKSEFHKAVSTQANICHRLCNVLAH